MRLRTRTLTIALVVTLLAGCDGWTTSRSSNDFDEARELASAALNAWKEGRTADLSVRDRPLRFDDEDARANLKLVSYEIRNPPIGWTAATGLSVNLSLRDAKGRRIVRHAVYHVTTSPDLAVIRND